MSSFVEYACDFDPTEVLTSKKQIDEYDLDFKNVLSSLSNINIGENNKSITSLINVFSTVKVINDSFISKRFSLIITLTL